MDDQLQRLVVQLFDADSISRVEVIQTLWSGYGQILKVTLDGGSAASVILKHVTPPSQASHPRGWSTDRSHQRKLRSYQVESAWYRDWSGRCGDRCRVPKCYLIDDSQGRAVFVLEDLDAAGFSARRSGLKIDAVKTCLSWLAEFHAEFIGEQPARLWSIGTYWHLDTRPDEWDVMPAGPLKDAAKKIDAALRESPYQTFVHGDAKVANFCFTPEGDAVAAVDFQYVGGGCGMKDVAYLLGSCISDDDCEQYEQELLWHYFERLGEAISRSEKQVDAVALERNWRTMFPLAWADFNRFLEGWCPGHQKLTGYSQKIAVSVVRSLD
ncbi:Phosphotransferase enzyme family protein [Planctomycetes bacterium K23_9]|uniref:Phosphotransferase enzyme family protein n=2 Tax=Stieleria marina TaxID=1930275 RepID=A0A517NMT2_9BACT|nr:Phosphotransferase enzyme family protein [Planctomycetes bacterium K23_9]